MLEGTWPLPTARLWHLDVDDYCLRQPLSLAVEVVGRPCVKSSRAFCHPRVFGRRRDQYKKLPASFRFGFELGKPRPASQELNRADRHRTSAGSLHHRRGRSSRQRHDCVYERTVWQERHAKAPPEPLHRWATLGDDPSARRGRGRLPQPQHRVAGRIFAANRAGVSRATCSLHRGRAQAKRDSDLVPAGMRPNQRVAKFCTQ